MRHLITALFSMLFVSGCVVETTGHHHSHHDDHYDSHTVYYPGTVRIYFIDTHPNRFCPPGHAYRGYCYLDKPDYDRAVKDPQWEKQAREKANQQQRQHDNEAKNKDRDNDQGRDNHQRHDDEDDDNDHHDDHDKHHDQEVDKEKSSGNKPKEDKQPSKGKKQKD